MWQRFMAAREYINALNNLPPTYEIGSVAGFSQFIPDPISNENLKIRLDAVNKAEKKLENVLKK